MREEGTYCIGEMSEGPDVQQLLKDHIYLLLSPLGRTTSKIKHTTSKDSNIGGLSYRFIEHSGQ